MQALVAGMGAGTGRGRGLIPPVPKYRSGPVGAAVVPGGFNQQPPHVGVTGLGDRALRPAGPGGILAGNQPQIGADARAGEAVPVADLDRQREPLNVEMPRRHASRRVSGLNSLSAASAVIFSSRRARRAVASTTA